MTATVRITRFTSPTARRKGTKPVSRTTHLVASTTVVSSGETIAVYTQCGTAVSLVNVDQTRAVSYLRDADRPATCLRCTRTPAPR